MEKNEISEEELAAAIDSPEFKKWLADSVRLQHFGAGQFFRLVIASEADRTILPDTHIKLDYKTTHEMAWLMRKHTQNDVSREIGKVIEAQFNFELRMQSMAEKKKAEAAAKAGQTSDQPKARSQGGGTVSVPDWL